MQTAIYRLIRIDLIRSVNNFLTRDYENGKTHDWVTFEDLRSTYSRKEMPRVSLVRL